MAAFTIPSIFKAIDKVTTPVRKMQASVKGFGKSATVSMQRASMSLGSLKRKISLMQASVKGFGRSATVSMQRASMSLGSFNRKISLMHANVKKKVKGILGSLGSLGAGIGLLMVGREIVNANIKVDNALQSLQAITGVTGKEFKSFAAQIDIVSKRQKIFAGNTAKAFELVGSAKPELLESAAALAKVTEAALILGKAGNLEVTDAVDSLTVSMNQFGVGADKAAEFVDILATAQQKGSGTIQYLSEAMVNAGGTSRAFGNSFEDTVAILEGFAKSGTPASEAGTMLAGILAKLSTAQKREFNPQFTKATDIINNLSKANLSYNDLLELTDVRGAKWLTTIINQNDVVQKLTGNLNEVGNAQSQANIQTMSFGILLKEIQAAFKNATTSTDSQNKSLVNLKLFLRSVADNMDRIVDVTLKIVKWFAIYKGVTILFKVAQLGLNTVIGLSNIATGLQVALSKKSVFALRHNIVALKSYKVAMGLVTAAKWFYNSALVPAISGTLAFAAALWANPITWIVIAIIALIAAIVLLVIHWKQVVTWIKKVWDQFKNTKFIKKVIEYFNNFIVVIKNVINKLKEIGKAIKTFVIDKFKAVSELVGNIVDRVAKFFGRKDTITAEETLRIQAEKQGSYQDIVSKNAGGDLVNLPMNQINQNTLTNKEVITNQNNKQQPVQKNNRVDLYINDRSKETQSYVEGDVDVHNTGY